MPTSLFSLTCILELLRTVSQDAESWIELLHGVFGSEIVIRKGLRIRKQWQDNQPGFSVRWVSEESLPEAYGAFAEESNSIIFNQSRLNGKTTAQQRGIVLEEIGHWLDSQLKGVDVHSDTPGDEGLAFAQQLSAQFPGQIEARDQTGPEVGIVKLDGKWQTVEFASASAEGKYFASIKIADRGARCSDGTQSAFGHMWISLVDNKGKAKSFGFAPIKSGVTGKGGINVHGEDDNYYLDIAFQRNIEITQAQYEQMLSAAPKAFSQGFRRGYNGITNSCIDYTWFILEKGGLNPGNFEGDIYPIHNVDDVEAIGNLEFLSTRVESEDTSGWIVKLFGSLFGKSENPKDINTKGLSIQGLSLNREATRDQAFGAEIPIISDLLEEATKGKPQGASLLSEFDIFSVQQSKILRALKKWKQGTERDLKSLREVLKKEFKDAIGYSTPKIELVNQDELRFTTLLSKKGAFEQSLSGDLGFKALGIKSKGIAKVTTEVNGSVVYGLDEDGLFIDTELSSGISIGLDARIPDAILEASLGPLTFRASDEDADKIEGNDNLDVDGDGLKSSNVGIDIDFSLVDYDGDSRSYLSEIAKAPSDYFELTTKGSGNINLDLSAKTRDSNYLPKLTTRYEGAFSLEGTDLKFNKSALSDLYIDSGPFVNTYIKPLAERMEEIIGPLQPLLKTLTRPLIRIDPNQSKRDAVSILDITEALGVTGKSEREFIENLTSLSESIRKVSSIAGGKVGFGSIDLRSLDLSDEGSKFSGLGVEALKDYTSKEDLKKSFGGTLSDWQAKASDLGELLVFPVFSDPSLLLKLLSDETVDFIRLELPEFEFSTSKSYSFPAFSIGVASIVLELLGQIDIAIKIGMGYDSRGLSQYQVSNNSSDLKNGLYLIDYPTPEAYARLALGIGARLDILLASAGVSGRVFSDLMADLNDIDRDGKMYYDEISERLKTKNLISLGGSIGLEAVFDIKTLSETIYEKKIATKVLKRLGKRNEALPPEKPIHASVSKEAQSLILNIGPRALARRTDGNMKVASDTEERVVLSNVNARSVKINGRYGSQSEKDGSSSTYLTRSLQEIVFDAGARNDVIDATNVRFASLNGFGGLGNDIIYGTALDDNLNGGEGDDQIYGLNGNDIIEGGTGNDQLHGGEGDDVLYAASRLNQEDGKENDLNGGAGNDIIYGSSSKNKIRGGDGDDYIVSNNPFDDIDLGDGNDLLYMNIDMSKLDQTRGYNYSLNGGSKGGETNTFKADFSTLDQLSTSEGLTMTNQMAERVPTGTRYQATVRYGYTTWWLYNFSQFYITGTQKSDIFIGMESDDRLGGEDGNDVFYLSSYIDRDDGKDVWLDSGFDIIDGGEGFDEIATFSLVKKKTDISLIATDDVIRLKEGGTDRESTWKSIEYIGSLELGAGNDRVILKHNLFGSTGFRASNQPRYMSYQMGDGDDYLNPGLVLSGQFEGGKSYYLDKKNEDIDTIALDYSIISRDDDKNFRIRMNPGSSSRSDGSQAAEMRVYSEQSDGKSIKSLTLYLYDFEKYIISGTHNDDNIAGYINDDRLDGGDGDDKIELSEYWLAIDNGFSGWDQVDGGKGFDTVENLILTKLRSNLRMTSSKDAINISADDSNQNASFVSIEYVRNVELGAGDDYVSLKQNLYGKDVVSADYLLGRGSDFLDPGLILEGELHGGNRTYLDKKNKDIDTIMLDYSVIRNSDDRQFRISMEPGSTSRSDGSQAAEMRVLSEGESIEDSTLYLYDFEKYIITGTHNNDIITGGNLDDRLTGGFGADTLTGGRGADEFIYLSTDQSKKGATLRDTITDFNGATGDRIVLSQMDGFEPAKGKQSFTYIGKKAFTGGRGEVRFQDGLLSFNTDKDLAAEMEVLLVGVNDFRENFLVYR